MHKQRSGACLSFDIEVLLRSTTQSFSSQTEVRAAHRERSLLGGNDREKRELMSVDHSCLAKVNIVVNSFYRLKTREYFLLFCFTFH